MNRLFLIALVFFSGSAVEAASAGRCEIVPEASLVQFSSHASFETFHGKTKEVEGHLAWSAGGIVPATVSIVIDASSLKTGNRLRDKDMYRFLETDRFDSIRFDLLRLPKISREKGGVTELLAEGNILIHGVTRRERISARVQARDERTLLIEADFPIKLSDYGIERPRFLWMKVAEEAEVTVRLSCSRPQR